MFSLQCLCHLPSEHNSSCAGMWLTCLMKGFNSGSSTAITHFKQEPAIQRAGNPDVSGGPRRKPSIITTSPLLSPVTWLQHHKEVWIHLLETFDNLFSPPGATLVAQMVKNMCNTGDLGSIPELGRTSGEEKGNPLQYCCLENSLNRGAQWATVDGVAKSQTQPNESHFLNSVWLTTPQFLPRIGNGFLCRPFYPPSQLYL